MPGGNGEVRFAVSTAAPNAIPTQIAHGSRPLKAIFVELTVNGQPNHENLPQPAVVTVDFTASDVPAGADPLKLKLYLSSDGLTWEVLDNTAVSGPDGSDNYRATATVPHFSFLALADANRRYFVPIAMRSSGGW